MGYDKIAARHRSAIDGLLCRHQRSEVRDAVDDQPAMRHGTASAGSATPAATAVASRSASRRSSSPRI
jgi:hypothetical protein